MHTYKVNLEYRTFATITVKAQNKDEAIELAHKRAETLDIMNEPPEDDLIWTFDGGWEVSGDVTQKN